MLQHFNTAILPSSMNGVQFSSKVTLRAQRSGGSGIDLKKRSVRL
ncbi:hypothetical protein [Paenibacillus sp. FSL E2-0151]